MAYYNTDNIIFKQTTECKKVESDISSGISRMETSEDKIARLEADLVLIADQEKLIVSQLAHIDSSKQKLLTIIENSEGEGAVDPKRKQYVSYSLFFALLNFTLLTITSF